MLKFVFWSLLCINAVLLAYGQGFLGNMKSAEREPARMKNQVNTDKLTLVSAATASAAAARKAAAPEPVPASAAAAPAPAEELACVVVGNFSAAEARRFEALLAPLALNQRVASENVASQEITSHIVFIPSLGSKEAADRKAQELKNLGVTSFFVMNDNTPMKYAISLGVFKSAAAAQTLLAALNKQGVTSARVAGRPSSVSKTAYRLRELDPATKVKVDAIAQRFPAQQSHACKQGA